MGSKTNSNTRDSNQNNRKEKQKVFEEKENEKTGNIGWCKWRERNKK